MTICILVKKYIYPLQIRRIDRIFYIERNGRKEEA